MGKKTSRTSTNNIYNLWNFIENSNSILSSICALIFGSTEELLIFLFLKMICLRPCNQFAHSSYNLSNITNYLPKMFVYSKYLQLVRISWFAGYCMKQAKSPLSILSFNKKFERRVFKHTNYLSFITILKMKTNCFFVHNRRHFYHLKLNYFRQQIENLLISFCFFSLFLFTVIT